MASRLLYIIPLYLLLLVIGLIIGAYYPFHPEFQQDKETLFQVSTIDAVLNGVYEGIISVEYLKKQGDFGIGTFDSLDGEMAVLNGVVYKIKDDGKAYPAKDNETTPFASITFFESDKKLKINQIVSLEKLGSYIDSELPAKNMFYAIKINGTFSYMKTRSVPKQSKPFPPLSEVTKNQPVFEYYNITGVIVGFKTPEFAKGVNVPGYHLHFIDENLTVGGHILNFTIISGEITIDYTPNFRMMLPSLESDFYKTDLTKDLSEQLNKAEK